MNTLNKIFIEAYKQKMTDMLNNNTSLFQMIHDVEYQKQLIKKKKFEEELEQLLCQSQ